MHEERIQIQPAHRRADARKRLHDLAVAEPEINPFKPSVIIKWEEELEHVHVDSPRGVAAVCPFDQVAAEALVNGLMGDVVVDEPPRPLDQLIIKKPDHTQYAFGRQVLLPGDELVGGNLRQVIAATVEIGNLGPRAVNHESTVIVNHGALVKPVRDKPLNGYIRLVQVAARYAGACKINFTSHAHGHGIQVRVQYVRFAIENRRADRHKAPL